MDYELSIAKRIADELVERLRSACVQIEIAGSVQRRLTTAQIQQVAATQLRRRS